MTIFPPLPIRIEERLVNQLLGYRKKSVAVPDKIRDAVKRELAISRELLRFKGVFGKFEVISNEPGRVKLENGYLIESGKFAGWIAGCSHLYLFAVTAGILFSERTSELLNRDEVSAAMIADAAGSAAAESCAETADNFIRSLEPDRKMTKRYSPGYGDWDVADNRIFLDYLKAKEAGISVNEGGLMRPEKSVSAAIGVYKRDL